MTSTWDTGSLTLYRDGNFFRLDTDDELDAREVERYEPEGVDYTPDARGGGRGRRRRATPQLAFLVRAADGRPGRSRSPARGETMPQKSTYFYPKLPPACCSTRV